MENTEIQIPEADAKKLREFTANINALVQRREGYMAAIIAHLGLDERDSLNFDFDRMVITKSEMSQE